MEGKANMHIPNNVVFHVRSHELTQAKSAHPKQCCLPSDELTKAKPEGKGSFYGLG